MYDRARLAVLSHVCAFSLQQEISGRAYPTGSGSRFDLELTPVVGDLVALTSAAIGTAFYLAWVEAVAEDGRTHTLRSVDDGAVCDWSNVGFMVFDRAVLAEKPHWRWSDEQYAFNDRWMEAFHGAFLYETHRRRIVRFDGDGCTITTERAGSGEGFERSFPSWRDLDDAALAELAREIKDGPGERP